MTESRYTRVLSLLQDGDWHGEDELRRVVFYPREWIRELQLEGKRLEVKNGGRLAVRLRPA